MKRIIVLLLALSLAISSLGCTLKSDNQNQSDTVEPVTKTETTTQTEPDLVKLDFYAHTDFIGNLEASDYAPGAAVFAAFIKNQIAGNPEGSFLFNLGDALSGTPIAALVEGESVVEVINAMPYDTFTLGNHEFDWGPETLIKTTAGFDIPILCANIIDKRTNLPLENTVPYVIIEKSGVNVGILGLITDATPTIIRAEYADQLEVLDTVETAKEYVPQMQAAGAEVIIVAGHLPMYQAEGSTTYNGELYDILTQVDGIDAAFGGHNETLCIAETINGIPTVKSAFYGAQLSHIRLTYDRTSKTITDTQSEIIDVLDQSKTLKPDSMVESIVGKYSEEANRIFDEKIGTAAVACDVDYFYECSITNWFADAVKEATGADMAFINPSGVFENVPAGDITLRKIYQMSPFENELVITEMTGAQLKELWETTLETERLPQYGTLAFSGLCITYDSSAPDGKRIISLTTPDGTIIKNDDVFTVATLDFLSTGGNDYSILAGLEWTGTAIMMRDAYANALSQMGTLTSDVKGWMTDISR